MFLVSKNAIKQTIRLFWLLSCKIQNGRHEITKVDRDTIIFTKLYVLAIKKCTNANDTFIRHHIMQNS